MDYFNDVLTTFLVLLCFNVETDGENRLSVMEGTSVTLESGVSDIHTDDVIVWRSEHGDSVIAKIDRGTKVFTTLDEADGRYSGTLELDSKTGSLTIRHIRTKHTGLYHLDITGNRRTVFKRFFISVCVSDAGSDGVSVKEGDPVTLHTDVKINHRDIMMWYFNTIRIAYINGVQKICTDKQCPERFRDGLKLDNQTGSLTITNTRTTDSGEYKLVGGSNSGKIFNVIVTAVTSLYLCTHTLVTVHLCLQVCLVIQMK
uniref:Immunoglobulin domain-containing protein n=1 Tax=Sinocyclocheilus anshuiensis TaxID=1608454 RepID=A0A671LYA9_9TELE